MYKLYVNNKDVTDYARDLTWSDSVDTLGVQLEFDLAVNRYDSNFKHLYDIGLGNIVQLINTVTKETIFQGIIVTESPQEKTSNFLCYDFAWYLNKSTVVKQFRGLSGKNCIEELCKEAGIKVVVKGLHNTIDKIYKDKSISDVIYDIIEQCTKYTTKKYYIEMLEDTLYIRPYEKIKVNGEYQISENDVINVMDYVGNVELYRSIAELKNSIKIVTADDLAVRIEGIAKDEESINKYGKLEKVEVIDEKDYMNAQMIAKNELKKLNVITEDFTLSILGDDKIRSGRVIDVDLPLFNIKGEYFIKESEHIVTNGIHKATIKVEVYRNEE